MLNFLLGLAVILGSMLGGFAAMGGKVMVIWQPWEYVIILGTSIGTFIFANPMPVVKDTGRAVLEAITGKSPKEKDYLALLSILYALMREMRTQPKGQVEQHFDNPEDSEIFKRHESVLKNAELTGFICDYFRLLLIGTARSHEIESLMDEEIHTLTKEQLKPYYALVAISEGLPAIGIIAAVLGVIKAMGALDQSPELLGKLIGAALVGTFAGIFFSYAIAAPIASKAKMLREKKLQFYVIVKQTLLAFMNGAMPQVALEYGRKTIAPSSRPSINAVEAETIGGGASAEAA